MGLSRSETPADPQFSDAQIADTLHAKLTRLDLPIQGLRVGFRNG